MEGLSLSADVIEQLLRNRCPVLSLDGPPSGDHDDALFLLDRLGFSDPDIADAEQASDDESLLHDALLELPFEQRQVIDRRWQLSGHLPSDAIVGGFRGLKAAERSLRGIIDRCPVQDDGCCRQLVLVNTPRLRRGSVVVLQSRRRQSSRRRRRVVPGQLSLLPPVA